MKSRWFLTSLILLIIFVSSLLGYYYLPHEEPKVIYTEKTSDFTNFMFKTIPEHEDFYVIRYGKEDIEISKFTFANEEEAKSFYEEFISNVQANTLSSKSVSFDGYKGLSFTGKEKRHTGIILTKGNEIIISNVKIPEMKEVIEWFIRNYC